MTVLRGMTWTGMIYNMFSKEPTASDAIGRQEQSVQSKSAQSEITSKRIPAEELATPRAKSPNEVSEEDMLSKLLETVTNLSEISVHMGEQIGLQNESIDRIDEKTVRVTEQTLAMTLKTSQFIQRISNSTDGFVGTYQFVEEDGWLLSVRNTELLLIPKEDISTLFFCYLKEPNIFGIQSAKTLKFLCSTVWGPVMAVGDSFARKEECYLSLSAELTGIYFLQTNWGVGGWLKNNEQLGEVVDKDSVALKSVTANISDKNGILLMKPVRVGELKRGLIERVQSLQRNNK
jgi:hypothetical protein